MNSTGPYGDLPQLSRLLDAASMTAVLNTALSGDRGPRIAGCRISRIKYRLTGNCLVTYFLKLDGVDEPVIAYCMACRAGESLELFRKAIQDPAPTASPACLARSIAHLPDLESVVRVFPNDRKLKGLSIFSSEAGIAGLKASLASESGMEFDHGHDLEIVQYVAERACTVRMSAGRVYGKFYARGEAGKAWRTAVEIWRSEARESGRLVVPRPLALLRDSESVWTEGLTGTPLSELDPGGDAMKQALGKAARSLAALHGVSIGGLSPASSSGIIESLDAAAGLIALARPDKAGKLREVIDRLRAASDALESSGASTIHGDLHLKNMFLLSDGRAALIDLDNLRTGDPAIDIGSFTAYLLYRAIAGDIPRSAVDELARSFAEYYAAAAGTVPAAEALRWHVAAALLNERAYRCITRMKKDYYRLAGELIDLALEYAK